MHLLQHIIETEPHRLEDLLINIYSKIGLDSLAAKLCRHSLAAGDLDKARYFLKMMGDSQLKTELFNLCNNGEITEDHFGNTTPSQCTDSVVYQLEQLSIAIEHLKENLPQLITAQEKHKSMVQNSNSLSTVPVEKKADNE